MGATTEISWTHSTFNPWHGCQRVSPGCEHCYAESFSKRIGLKIWDHKRRVGSLAIRIGRSRDAGTRKRRRLASDGASSAHRWLTCSKNARILTSNARDCGRSSTRRRRLIGYFSRSDLRA